MTKSLNIGCLGLGANGRFAIGIRWQSRGLGQAAFNRFWAEDAPRRPERAVQRVDLSPDGEAVVFEQLLEDQRRQHSELNLRAASLWTLQLWTLATVARGVRVYAFEPGAHDRDNAVEVTGDEDWGEFTGAHFTDDFEKVFAVSPPANITGVNAPVQAALALASELPEWVDNPSRLSCGLSSVLAIRLKDAREFFGYQADSAADADGARPAPCEPAAPANAAYTDEECLAVHRAYKDGMDKAEIGANWARLLPGRKAQVSRASVEKVLNMVLSRNLLRPPVSAPRAGAFAAPSATLQP